MPEWLVNILGAIYTKIPIKYRPLIKKIFYGTLIRIQSVFLCRKIFKGRRVTFVDFEVADLEPFEYLGPGKNEVLIEADKSIVSPGTEKAVLCALPGARRSFPYIPGYSTAGTILKVGRNINGFKKKDRVAGRIHHMSHSTMTPVNLFHVPDNVSLQDASFIELGIITLQGIRKSSIKPGDKVAVLGQGIIGQLSNRLARLVGGSPIIAVANSCNRKNTAMLPGGADKYISLAEESCELEKIQADVVIEAVGSPKAVYTAMHCARAGGRVVLLGSARGLGRNVNVFSLAQSRNLEIVGAHIGAMPEQDCSPSRWTYKQEGYLFLELLQRRRLSVESLVTWYAAPDECNAVYEVLAKGGGPHVGILFDWRANQ